MEIRRRTFLACLAVAPTVTHSKRANATDAGLGDLDVREVRLAPSSSASPSPFGDAFVMATPTHLAAGERVPLVVLLHGLGETVDTRLGMHAWVDRYGLASAYARLCAARAEAPFRGLAFACPYVPNVTKPKTGQTTGGILDAYTRFVVDVVAPRARAEAGVRGEASTTAVAGCSLGGFVGLELFLRKPEAFGAFAGVQTAISAASAKAYEGRISRAVAAAGPRALLLETSTQDPFRAANAALSAALRSRTIPHDFSCAPGPHDQPWLRQSGTPTLLAWLDARLA